MKPGYNTVVLGLWFPFQITLDLLIATTGERVRNGEIVGSTLFLLSSSPSHCGMSGFKQTELLSMWKMSTRGANNVPVIFKAGVEKKKHWILMMFIFFITQCPWESKGTVFFFFCAQSKIAETSRHYLAKSRPNICDAYWHIDFPWQLLAEGVRRMGPCVRVHGSSVRSRQHYAHQENEA